MDIKFKNISDFGLEWHLQGNNLKRKMAQHDEHESRPPGKYNCLAYVLQHDSLDYDYHFGLYRTKGGMWVLEEHREEKK